jgi:hypothetical protein
MTMLNNLLVLYTPFGAEAFETFYAGLPVMAYGMGTVIAVLFAFYAIIKLLIKLFPEKE